MSETHPYEYLLGRFEDRLAEPREQRETRVNDNDIVFDGLRAGNTLEEVYGVAERAMFQAAGQAVLIRLKFDLIVQGRDE